MLRVTLRRLDLAADIHHLREPEKIALVMSPDKTIAEFICSGRRKQRFSRKSAHRLYAFRFFPRETTYLSRSFSRRGRSSPFSSPPPARGGRERTSLCLGRSLKRKVSRSAELHSAITAPQTSQLATVRSWTCKFRTSTEYKAPQLSQTKSLRPAKLSQDFAIQNSQATRREPTFSAWRPCARQSPRLARRLKCSYA